MAKTAADKQIREELGPHEYSFTVVFEPLANDGLARRNGRRSEKSASPGYQVTVPLLPGIVTYGRTLSEAREMARDAIKCHLEGLREDGERIPNEKSARKEIVRVALSA